jgi:hypothetical protein
MKIHVRRLLLRGQEATVAVTDSGKQLNGDQVERYTLVVQF